MKRRSRFQPSLAALEPRVALTGGEPPLADAPEVDVDVHIEVDLPPGPPSTTIPAPHELAYIRVNGAYQPIGWMDLHNQFVARLRDPYNRPSTLVFGDSITHDWAEIGKRPWSSWIARLGAANLGVAGDLTQNLLWRLESGELDSRPRGAIVMIGLNNLGVGDSVEDTAAGVLATVRTINRLSPPTRVLLLGILPTLDAELNTRIAAVNLLLAAGAPQLGARFVDLTGRFYTSDGRLRERMFADTVHLTEAAYREISASISHPLRQIALAQPLRQRAARPDFFRRPGRARAHHAATVARSAGANTSSPPATTSTRQPFSFPEVITPAGSPSSWTGTGPAELTVTARTAR
jgi:beta-glucosidase